MATLEEVVTKPSPGCEVLAIMMMQKNPAGPPVHALPDAFHQVQGLVDQLM
jgi:hypothetical protein